MSSSSNLQIKRTSTRALPLIVFLAAAALSAAWLYTGATPRQVVQIVSWRALGWTAAIGLMLVWFYRRKTAAPAPSGDAIATVYPCQGGAPYVAAIKTTPTPEDGAGELAPELAAALADLDAGRFAQALEAAAPHASSARPTLRLDALRICALATARLEQWPASLCYWDRLFAVESTAHNALQVATSAVMAGDIRGGEAWLASARKLNAASREMPALSMLTNFVTALAEGGQCAAALPYLDEIRDFYLAGGVTDPTYLFVRGMPSFGVFLDKSAAIVNATLGPMRAQAWYAAMLPRLDDAGVRQLSAWLAHTFASDATPAA